MVLLLLVSANPGSSPPIVLPPMQLATGMFLSAYYCVKLLN